ncbi:MAG: ribonuclease R [Nitrospirae bacterium]|nr:ribonuclease R [Nitrospirota bacterium]
MTPNDIKDKESVLTFLKTKTSRPVSLREIATALGIPQKEARQLLKIPLKSLIDSGEVYETRAGLYGLTDKMNLVTGFFEAHKDGYGFVIPDKSGERDIFIPPRKTLGAMSGDRVIARIESTVRKEGSIIKILERSQKKVVGKFHVERASCYVKPKNKKIPFDIYINPKDRNGAKNGDMIVAELTSYPSVSRPPEGRVLKIVPEVDEPSLEVETTIEEYSLSPKFPAIVMQEAHSLSDKISPHGRVDHRKSLTVTIDGEMAKDFDDAVSINKTRNGFTLWVHIADASHYVTWESALDLEARQRGTSVYFPHRVIPMLPKELSNNLCSLIPRADRLTVTIEIHFDKNGHMIEKNFYPSIINSNERMTYTSVRKILVDNDPDERYKYTYLLDDFEAMEELCGLLRQQRLKRGSLDFDLPEPEVLLDIQGRPEAIIRAERNLAHMIIEEFMIAANEAVASYLEESGIPSIYRVHEKPDGAKIDELKPIFKAFGLQTKKTGVSGFRSILKEVKGKPEESLLNIVLLRSLKQAKYSTENTGHFGLASRCYTHFTSPIRRYPDLVVHRILKDSLGNKLNDKKIQYLKKILHEIAPHSSRRERLADEAEREVINAMRVWFMKDKVGEEYKGFVSNIAPYGLKIQFMDFFIEGFLHVSYMHDDYYWFNEQRYCLTGRRTGKTFSIGKEIRVRIERVDIEGREVVLAMT